MSFFSKVDVAGNGYRTTHPTVEGLKGSFTTDRRSKGELLGTIGERENELHVICWRTAGLNVVSVWATPIDRARCELQFVPDSLLPRFLALADAALRKSPPEFQLVANRAIQRAEHLTAEHLNLIS